MPNHAMLKKLKTNSWIFLFGLSLNLTGAFLAQVPPSLQIWWQSAQVFLHNPAEKQTNPKNRQGAYIKFKCENSATVWKVSLAVMRFATWICSSAALEAVSSQLYSFDSPSPLSSCHRQLLTVIIIQTPPPPLHTNCWALNTPDNHKWSWWT